MTDTVTTTDIVNINRHNPPVWFKNADLGIFIHWGLYSVPAYAPVESPDFLTISKTKSDRYLFKNQPYAEWYQNSMRIKASPVYEYHKKTYGDMPYEKFADTFKKTAKQADVDKLADSFSKAGAKYVVFVSKHHDGFMMFDSKYENPNMDGYMLDFDFTKDLATACRKKGMRFGVYYSSLLDWSFTKKPVRTIGDLVLGNDKSQEYANYCLNHWMEIIDRYNPDILWSDIGYPQDERIEQIFKAFYEQNPEGLINDRWAQWPNWLRNPIGRTLFTQAAKIAEKRGSGDPLGAKYYDYRTIEYSSEFDKQNVYFEMCRGMDKSFGYNRYSKKQDHMDADQIISLIRDLSQRRGRLLLNVGLDEYGNIPVYQQAILDEPALRKI